MLKMDKKARFVEMRGRGESYHIISKEIGVSTRTLVNWSKELSSDISNHQAMELERLRDEYMLTRADQIRIAGSQLGKINKELLIRDFSELSTSRLFEMQQKLMNGIVNDNDKMEFAEVIPAAGQEALDGLMKKVIKWTG